MDSLTHALSGALLARAAARRTHGAAQVMPATQRLVVGALAAAFPDLDVLLTWVSSLSYLTAHRGLTHSFIMLPVWAVALGWLAARAFRRRHDWRTYTIVAALGIAIHILGDVITSFGTMIFAPLSDARYSLDTTFIIDLWFSGIILAGLLASWYRPVSPLPARAALVLLVAYVGLQGMLQGRAIDVGREFARANAMTDASVRALPRPPTPLNWTVTIRDGQQYRYAHINLLRREPVRAAPDAGLIGRIDASFRPVTDVQWRSGTQFGETATEVRLAREAWSQAQFGFYRWFAELPMLYRIDAGTAPCVWFYDLRFVVPGRESLPFRYGLCRNGEGWERFELLADGLRRALR
jgi:inner membrane protein